MHSGLITLMTKLWTIIDIRTDTMKAPQNTQKFLSTLNSHHLAAVMSDSSAVLEQSMHFKF